MAKRSSAGRGCSTSQICTKPLPLAYLFWFVTNSLQTSSMRSRVASLNRMRRDTARSFERNNTCALSPLADCSISRVVIFPMRFPLSSRPMGRLFQRHGFGDDKPSAAAMLGLVQGGIGARDKRIHGVIGRDRRNADAHAVFHQLQYFCGHPFGNGDIREQHDGKLIAAHAAGMVHVLAHGLTHRPCHALEIFIAILVTVGVIDLLEIIQVEQNQAQRFTLALAAQHGLAQAAVVGAAVVKAGEAVCLCLADGLHPLAFFLFLPTSITVSAGGAPASTDNVSLCCGHARLSFTSSRWRLTSIGISALMLSSRHCCNSASSRA